MAKRGKERVVFAKEILIAKRTPIKTPASPVRLRRRANILRQPMKGWKGHTEPCGIARRACNRHAPSPVASLLQLSIDKPVALCTAYRGKGAYRAVGADLPGLVLEQAAHCGNIAGHGRARARVG